MPRTGKAFNLYLSEEERAALEALAASLGRSLHDEIRHAVARHLANPPVLEAPPLPPAEPEAAPVPKKRARKRRPPAGG